MSEGNTYQDELVANFEQLRQERGWTTAAMAEHIEVGDPSLAAEYRKRHAARSDAPKARKAASRSEA